MDDGESGLATSTCPCGCPLVTERVRLELTLDGGVATGTWTERTSTGNRRPTATTQA